MPDRTDPTPPPLRPSAMAEARAFLLDPAAAAHPGRRITYWAALKSARGQRIRQDRLQLMQKAQEHGHAAWGAALDPAPAAAPAWPEDAA
ncbi:MAG: hypothetical protein ACK4OP_01565 [Gemmobacter sp.]